MRTRKYLADNRAGWQLALYQAYDHHLCRERSPLLIVPGYGMNSSIFAFHPGGPSMERFLTSRGFEVWRVDLRGQGGSRSTGGGRDYLLEDLALADLSAAVDAVLAHTRTRASSVDLIGASLGATLMFMHVVLHPGHRVSRLVSMGGPVRWVKAHPAVRLAFRSPALAGLVPLFGTRRLAGVMLPQVARFAPTLLSMYINPQVTDVSTPEPLLATVEDPSRHINRQIAKWLRAGDLIVGGRNISEELAGIRLPLLCVLAVKDGIVPPRTALFPIEKVGSPIKSVLKVGDADFPVAHADLFICREAQARVFAPIAEWLVEH